MPRNASDNRIPDFKKGAKSLKSTHLNQLVKSVNRLTSGVDLPSQSKTAGKAGAVAAVAFTLVSVSNDYLVCTDANGNTVNIAKPYELRYTPFHGQTINGITYTYSSSTQRSATDGTDTETQYITPNYVAGAEIIASKVKGGTGVTSAGSYLEHDQGRAWAYDEALPAAQIAAMVSLQV